MSALGGIYNFDGAPVDDELLMRLGDALSARGPDGGSEFKFGPIGMVYRAFHTNKESRMELQPLVSSRGHVLCWDGRLDNREELIDILREELQGDHTDVAIVMAAYLTWERDFLPRIIGDYALSLWDPAPRTLLLSRDPIGTRTLYYHRNDLRIIWSTELSPLLDLPTVPLEINDEYVADFLVCYPTSGQTPYKNMHGVPPANAVITTNGDVHTETFWTADPTREIHYATDADYAEHFRELFRQAVCCRLRTDGPVWAELSGGLDSSSIVCTADDLIKSGRAEARCLRTVSFVYDECSSTDERAYIRLVEEKIGRSGLHLREDDYPYLAPMPAKYAPVLPNPAIKLARYYEALNLAMLRDGARVLLSGEGGDEIVTSSRNPSPRLADLLVSGRILELHRHVGRWSQALNKPYLTILWKRAIVPALPSKLHCILNRQAKPEDILDARFVKRMNLNGRAHGASDTRGFRDHTRRAWHYRYQLLVRVLSAGYWQEFYDISVSYPFSHRPLVEFLQAIPFDQRVRPYETRSVLRRALCDVLPSGVATRNTKTRNTEVVIRAVAREYERLRAMLKDARVCALGYVSRHALLTMLDQAGQGRELSCAYVATLLPLELWLRSLEHRRAVAGSPTPPATQGPCQ